MKHPLLFTAQELLVHQAWTSSVEMNLFDGSYVFETLMSPFNLTRRYAAAVRLTEQQLQKWQSQPRPRPVMSLTRTLSLGFCSHDIASHPTAYMLEGLLLRIRAVEHDAVAPVTTTLYAYGKEDNSSVRARLKVITSTLPLVVCICRKTLHSGISDNGQ